MKHLILIFIFLLLEACTTPVKLDIPTNRFMTPGTAGGAMSGSVRVGSGAVTSYTLVKDISSNPPDSTTEVGPGNVGKLMINFDLGLFERLDFILLGSAAGLKCQLFGEKTGFQLSIAGTGSAYTLNVTSTANSGGESVSQSKINENEFGLSLGTKSASSVTPYISYFRKFFKADSAVTVAGSNYNYVRTGVQSVAALGLSFESGSFQFILEGTQATGELSSAKSSSDTGYGLMLGFKW